MNKKLVFLLIPLLLLGSCAGNSNGNSNKNSGNNGGGTGDVVVVDDADEYENWLNSWSQPNHLYFHYNRGSKGGYENYCLWLWQHSPQDLEGALYAYSGTTDVSEKLSLVPMTNHWMTNEEVGKEGNGTYLDSFGVIADVDLKASNLVGGKVLKGKTPNPTSFDGMDELGFLIPQVEKMDGSTNWVSDGEIGRAHV